MPDFDGDCRIRDIVRDSKVLRDFPSKPYLKFDSSSSEPNRDLDGWRHHLYYGHHRVGRDFPRTTMDGVAAGFCSDSHMDPNKKEGRQVLCSLNQDLRTTRARDLPRKSSSEHHLQLMGFPSSFDEIDSGLFLKTEKEDPFHGYYLKHGGLIYRFKKNLPVFDGFWHGEDLLRWIAAIDDFFEEIKLPEHVKCKIVWLKTKGRAYYWWKQLQQERNELGKREVTSWAMMKNLLLNKFLPMKCSTKCLVQSYNSSTDESDLENDEDNKSSSAGGSSVEEQPKEALERKPGKCLIQVPKENTVFVSEIVNGQQVGEVILGANNILAAENCEEENIEDDLEEIDVEDHSKESAELESAACSIKLPLEADLNNNYEKKELSYLGMSEFGIETLEKSTSHLLNCVGFSKALKFPDHIGNEVFYEVGRDGYKHFDPGGLSQDRLLRFPLKRFSHCSVAIVDMEEHAEILLQEVFDHNPIGPEHIALDISQDQLHIDARSVTSYVGGFVLSKSNVVQWWTRGVWRCFLNHTQVVDSGNEFYSHSRGKRDHNSYEMASGKKILLSNKVFPQRLYTNSVDEHEAACITKDVQVGPCVLKTVTVFKLGSSIVPAGTEFSALKMLKTDPYDVDFLVKDTMMRNFDPGGTSKRSKNSRHQQSTSLGCLILNLWLVEHVFPHQYRTVGNCFGSSRSSDLSITKVLSFQFDPGGAQCLMATGNFYFIILRFGVATINASFMSSTFVKAYGLCDGDWNSDIILKEKMAMRIVFSFYLWLGRCDGLVCSMMVIASGSTLFDELKYSYIGPGDRHNVCDLMATPQEDKSTMGRMLVQFDPGGVPISLSVHFLHLHGISIMAFLKVCLSQGGLLNKHRSLLYIFVITSQRTEYFFRWTERFIPFDSSYHINFVDVSGNFVVNLAYNLPMRWMYVQLVRNVKLPARYIFPLVSVDIPNFCEFEVCFPNIRVMFLLDATAVSYIATATIVINEMSRCLRYTREWGIGDASPGWLTTYVFTPEVVGVSMSLTIGVSVHPYLNSVKSHCGVVSLVSLVIYATVMFEDIIKHTLVSDVENCRGLGLRLAGFCGIYGAKGTSMCDDGELTEQLSTLSIVYSCIFASLYLTRGRVNLSEEWNDGSNFNTFSMDRQSNVTMQFVGKNGQTRESLKLFYKVVNGLDPPFNVDCACIAPILISISSLVDELLRRRDGDDVARPVNK